MARIKAPPRVAQPDLEPPAFSPIEQVMSSAINNHQVMSDQASDDGVNHSTENRISSKLATIPASENLVLSSMATITASEQPSAQESSLAEELLQVGNFLALNHLICPQCLSKFPDIGIKEFREHVESCSRPVTGDSESTTSSLSPPPESHHRDEEDGESIELDHLTPYVAGEFTSYPESKGDAAGSGDIETADSQSRTNFAKITDSQKFVDSLDDMEELPYEVAFRRIKNASETLVQWQSEWMDLDRFIEVTEPVVAPAKPHKNPRIPKETQIGIGYRDELESFMYGFEYQYHQTKVGKQNPLRQRYTNGANGGRELRQRVPTQKAVEADLSTSADSDGGVSTRRRGRGQKAREETADVDSAGGRGQRVRNNSRIDSQSRDQTPANTFPSGKKRGRPAKAKTGGAARLQELQREEGYEYDSTPEPSHDQNAANSTEAPGSLIRKRSYGLHETLETTENWQEETEQDEQASRPGTSDSTMTGPSDDMSNPPVRSSGRGRKRQNTSDFEDALPSHKRIRKANNPTSNGIGELDLAQSTRDFNSTEKTRNTRRGRHDEDGLPGDLAASEATLADSTARSQDLKDIRAISGSKIDGTMQKNQNGKERKMITLKTSNGIPRTPANEMVARNTVTEPLSGMSAQQDGKDGPKVSRASLNMMRRWAAKKQAEALGLPVPKIGRYPKGGSASSTPDVAGAPDPLNPLKQPGGRKRKRDEDPHTANTATSDAVAVNNEAPALIKKRGGRPKKIRNEEPQPNVESAGQPVIREGNQSNALSSDKEDTKHEEPVMEVVPKRKGGRPKKKPLAIEDPVQNAQEGHEPIQQTGFDTNNSQGKADDAGAVILPHDVEPTDQSPNSAQPQLRRTTRVRRQTSAALSASSQANTQRSGRSSQKSTVTPTPAPVQVPGEEPLIKQETVAGPALPRKRGRQPKSAKTDVSPEATATIRNAIEDEAPPAKRRRVGRLTKVVSTGSTGSTPTESDDEHTSPLEGSSVAQNSGSRKRKASVLNIPARPEVLSDGQATSAEPPLPKKPAKKTPITDLHATDAPSVTPGSSVEPLVPKKRGGRPRKNANVGGQDVSVKAEDMTRLPDQLTPGVKGFGPDDAVGVNTTGELTVGRQATDLEPPRKKGNWGGRRVKGVYSSGVAPKHAIASGSDANNGADGVEEEKWLLGESRNKNPLTRAAAPSDEMGADAVDAVDAVDAADTHSRRGRDFAKSPALVGDGGTYDAGPEALSYSPSRPKRAITIAELPAKETDHGEAVPESPSGAPARPRRAVTMSVVPRAETTMNDVVPEASSDVLSRSKRAAPFLAGSEGDAQETGLDGKVSGDMPRPRRVIAMKISPPSALVSDKLQISSNAILATESVGKEVNDKVEKRKKGQWGWKRTKATKPTDDANEKDILTKLESDDDDSDSEATRKEKKMLAARASKSLKNSQSMKARWANGSMHELMKKKREANLAKKAAAAQAAENGEELGESGAMPVSAPPSAPSKRKSAQNKAAARGPKRRRTMNATMDGPADTDDEYDIPDASSSGPTSPTGRRVSEYERYQQLSSPLRSPQSRRKRRSAALRASRSFSRFTDEGDDFEMMDDDDGDVETELKKQFDSEYEHFRAQTPPPQRGLQSSNILPGKRKPKPVINLAEAMRIEAGDEDDFLTEG